MALALVENNEQPTYPNNGPHLYLVIKVAEQIFRGLIDTASLASYAGPDLRQAFLDVDYPLRKKEKTVISSFGFPITVSEHYTVSFDIQDTKLTGEMSYFPQLQYDAIFGMNILEVADLQILLMGQQLLTNDNSGNDHAEDVEMLAAALPMQMTRPYKNAWDHPVQVPVPADPFIGIALKGKHHHRQFFIHRPWGPILVRMNRGGTRAFMKFRDQVKRMNIPK